jgi:hypothetical protein
MKARLQPAGRQAARVFTPPSLSGSSAHQAAVLEALGEIRGALGDMSGLLDKLAPAVLAQKTVQLDAAGTAFDQFRVPFRSIGVDYFGSGTLTVAAAPLGVGAPGPGVGVAKVGPGGFAVCNMRSTVVSFYGNPGDFVTFTAYALPQPANGVTSGAAGVTVTASPYLITAPLQSTSVTAAGSVTSAGAGAQIAATGILPAGLWEIWVSLILGGTPAAATDQNNIKLRNVQTNLPLIVPGAGGVPYLNGPFRYQSAGLLNANVASIAAATAGAIYSALIIANQIG